MSDRLGRDALFVRVFAEKVGDRWVARPQVMGSASSCGIRARRAPRNEESLLLPEKADIPQFMGIRLEFAENGR